MGSVGKSCSERFDIAPVMVTGTTLLGKIVLITLMSNMGTEEKESKKERKSKEGKKNQ